MSDFVNCPNCGFTAKQGYKCSHCGHNVPHQGAWAVYIALGLALAVLFGPLIMAWGANYRRRLGLSYKLLSIGAIILAIIITGCFFYNACNPYYGSSLFPDAKLLDPELEWWCYSVLTLNLGAIAWALYLLKLSKETSDSSGQ